jgi:hypothetical protein
MSAKACLHNAARRLRHLRAEPLNCLRHYPEHVQKGAEEAAAAAFEFSLLVLLDEFGMRDSDEFPALFWGSQLPRR